MLKSCTIRSILRLIALCSVLLTSFERISFAQLRPVSAEDCVKVRYVEGMWISRSGMRVAYLVKTPDISRNQNKFELFVRDIDGSSSSGRLLIEGDDISDVQWVQDDSNIAALVRDDKKKHIVFVDTNSAVPSRFFTIPTAVTSFVVDAEGKTMVYKLEEAPSTPNDDQSALTRRNAPGYRVQFIQRPEDNWATMRLFIVRSIGSDWGIPTPITITSPFSARTFSSIPWFDPTFMSLSPDGRWLTFNYAADDVPAEWGKNPFVKAARNEGIMLRIMVVYDLSTGHTALPIATIFPDSTPVWSKDSRYFFLTAHSPIGSRWEADDIRDNLMGGADANLFRVDIASGAIEQIIRHVPRHHEGVLFIRDDDTVVARTSDKTVATFRRATGRWSTTDEYSVPSSLGGTLRLFTSNGYEITAVHEDIETPENLFTYRRGDEAVRYITDLNPQLRSLAFSKVQSVHWSGPNDLPIDGLLLMPNGYKPGVRYPLVIQTKAAGGWFMCDSGFNHAPAFAPQPLSGAGIMYLVRKESSPSSRAEELRQRPKQYPGQIGEAVQSMEIWETAVEALAKQGLVDPARVGIIGFSRTGFHVEFDLVHSKIKYAAATISDNALYSLSEYWWMPAIASTIEGMYGGPPYGSTLANWQRYSISYNLERVNTPLLMEAMGYGLSEPLQHSFPENIPSELGVRYELVKGLSRLGKPVEYYYYPNEDHEPEHPQARLSSLERNIDWYEYWLLGKKNERADKADQYERWDGMKDRMNAQAGIQ